MVSGVIEKDPKSIVIVEGDNGVITQNISKILISLLISESGTYVRGYNDNNKYMEKRLYLLEVI